MSLSALGEIYRRTTQYLSAVGEPGSSRDVSRFWQPYLAGRSGYPTFAQMLVMRRGFTYPMAERRGLNDEEGERHYSFAAEIVARTSVPDDFLTGLDEPMLGSPVPGEFDGRPLTPNCLVNSVTVHAALEACRRAGIAERPLRVLEIGAGFGQAARMIIERLDIRTYAVCDLPENLFLSAFYLQGLYPEREAAFVDEHTDGSTAALAFVVPPLVDQLGGRFDLILNSYSFQEMKRSSVNEYFEFASRMLVPDGLFYSLNAHGKDEVELPSEYPIERFAIDHIGTPRKLPFQLTATIPYELALRPRGDSPSVSPRFLDAFGCSFQLGLDDDLRGLCDSFAAHTLTDAESAWLDNLAGIYLESNEERKRHHAQTLQESEILPSVSRYIDGCLRYGLGDRDGAKAPLEEAALTLSSRLARVNANVMLATLTNNDASRATHRVAAGEIAPHLNAAIKEVSANYLGFRQHVRECLRLNPAAFSPDSRVKRTVRRIGGSIPARRG